MPCLSVDARVGRVLAARRPRVYYARGPRCPNTLRPGSIHGETLEGPGTQGVGAEPGRGALERVSIEQLPAWNPEVIVTIDANCFNGVWRDALWQGPAVERRRP